MRDVTFGTVLVVGVMSVGFVLAQSATTGPTVKPNAVAAKATSPAPAPTNSKQTKSAGAGKVNVSTANNSGDDDSFWVERVDVDGDGDVEDSNLVWDDEDKVLYAYSVGETTCRNGGTATVALLVATNATGNPRSRPAGSGFWLADLDKGECGAQAAALWGCKFDASGNETACGIAAYDEKTDDLIIASASK